eukprot:CAMPEP_0194194452 /NCGR_PEP_ID=MMETSP0154-20130528/75587_1 /TAXON_ID=1049557 /ORGANISM="Thalassiothrix antarctica, Strain L6-D1" /LENGTH=403 /DNA_ID=CAMNT_0038918883 /DNA_START=1240 /DNA_END=2450 /DNA_ORIENTATION=+
MVSHSWDEPVREFVESIEQSAEDLDLSEDTTFWICALSIYQNNDISDNIHVMAEEIVKVKYDFLVRELVETTIKPATDGLGISYALLMNQEEPKETNIMVSHSWDEPVKEFVESIEQLAKDLDLSEDTTFWICALSIYQNNDKEKGPTIGEQLGPDPENGPFATILRTVKLMIVVLTSASDVYSRLWCVYEMYMATQLGVKVVLSPYGRSYNFYLGMMEVQSGNMKADICISNLHKPINSIRARCGHPSQPENEDEKMIRRVINTSRTKFAGLDEAVESIRFQYLVGYKTHNIDEKYREKGFDGLKEAIETALPRLPNKEKYVSFESIFDKHCSLNPGYKEYKGKDPDYEAEVNYDPDYEETFTNKYILVNNSGSETVDIFQEWLNALRDTLNAELSQKKESL